MKNNYCVIMAGGVGSRFWPVSTTQYPKQFHDILNSGETLIQQTFRRLTKLAPKENIFIVTNEIYKALLEEQLPDLKPHQVMYEPSMRNTAPCIAYASYKIHQINPNARILTAPSDHLILNEDAFVSIASKALDYVEEKDELVTLGITPTRPDTGYGYIQFQENDQDFKKVKTFTEKPNLEIAQKFIDSGDFLWNSGIFVWSAKTIINAFKTYLADDHEWFSKGYEFYNRPEEKKFIDNIYHYTTKTSIDYAIMEKANNVMVHPSSFGWSDVGTWGSLYDHMSKDEKENAIKGKCVKTYESSNNIIHVENQKVVVIEGLDNYIVVDTPKALLICKKESEQRIKTFVNELKTNIISKKVI